MFQACSFIRCLLSVYFSHVNLQCPSDVKQLKTSQSRLSKIKGYIMNFNNANTNFTNINDKVETLTNEKNSGLIIAIAEIKKAIEDIKDTYNLNSRKSAKIAREHILGNDSKDFGKDVKRAYSIGFGIVTRNVSIDLTLLSVAQIENLVNHGEVNAINALFNDTEGEDYKEAVREYLKELKTRVISVKTFEKRGRK